VLCCTDLDQSSSTRVTTLSPIAIWSEAAV
jgi:hypothetical protein